MFAALMAPVRVVMRLCLGSCQFPFPEAVNFRSFASPMAPGAGNGQPPAPLFFRPEAPPPSPGRKGRKITLFLGAFGGLISQNPVTTLVKNKNDCPIKTTVYFRQFFGGFRPWRL